MKSWRRAEREEEKGLHPREKVSALLRESGVARAPGAAACQKKMDTKMPGAQVSDGPNVRRPDGPNVRTFNRLTTRRPDRRPHALWLVVGRGDGLALELRCAT